MKKIETKYSNFNFDIAAELGFSLLTVMRMVFCLAQSKFLRLKTRVIFQYFGLFGVLNSSFLNAVTRFLTCPKCFKSN